MYKVWQFNSWKGLWKQNVLTYALTSAVPLKYSPCEAMHFVSAAGNSLENRFPEYLELTSCCFGC
jgi:hypothetical protein